MLSDDILISARGVSKRFQLGQFVSLASTLRTIKRFLTGGDTAAPLLPSGKHARFEQVGDKKYLWALQNINFDLRRGERVGILGRNGAGKSTLLKILVGIMASTEGAVERRCRVVPLMGIGAGFNAELSGRENVFVYGSVLGIPLAELRERYEDIVAFAEIAEFMDTPVKRYSKGMRARLSMAIALNLEPEVLVVDEVLAVGDVMFRVKCMEAMEALCARGMTLLFVSHSPSRVKSLCNRAILLRDGNLVADGAVGEVLEEYLRDEVAEKQAAREEARIDDEEEMPATFKKQYGQSITWPLAEAPGDDAVQITRVMISNAAGEEQQPFDVRDPITLEMEYVVHANGLVLRPQFQFYSYKNNELFATVDSDVNWQDTPRTPGVYRSRAIIPGNTLRPQSFVVGAAVYEHRPLVKHARTGSAVAFTLTERPGLDTARSGYPRLLPGLFWPMWQWKTECLETKKNSTHAA